MKPPAVACCFDRNTLNRRVSVYRNLTKIGALLVVAGLPLPVIADENIDELRTQLKQLKQDYESRINALEKRLQDAEQSQQQLKQDIQEASSDRLLQQSAPGSGAAESRFNPAISLILDGRYSDFSQDPEEYTLAGFPLGGESGPGSQGLALGHSELVISANADDKFFGRFTAAFDTHDGETHVEVEEAFLETLALPYATKLRAGRFYSSIGYLNSKHEHQWDFADAPLVYRGLFGNSLLDDGVQLSWVAPTDLYLELGSELFSGGRYPIEYSGDSTIPAYTMFAKLGGDIGISHSWQAGLSLIDAKVDYSIESEHGHGHEDEHEGEEEHLSPTYSGDTVTWGFDLVYKWAPQGNFKQRNLVLQYEYFNRDYDGMLSADHDGMTETGSYDGSQSGWYAQAIYQFRPRWRLGIRYDALQSTAKGSSEELISEAGLDSVGHDPWRYSLMADWANSEFSRLRLQYGHDKSSLEASDYWVLQYVLSLGAHGAHRY
jgi:hypothetical protein